MQRLSYLSVSILLMFMLSALAGCGGGGGGETPITATGPAAGDTAEAAPPSAGPQAAGVVKLAWDAPVAENGALPDVAGYRLRYGTAVGSYATTVDIGTATSCTVSDLPPGTYYFTVTAYDSSGSESDYSNETSYTIPS